MKEELETLYKETLSSLSQASSAKEVNDIRVRILGRKGSLTQLLKGLGALPEGDRREMGKRANEIKEGLESRIEEALSRIQGQERKESLEKEKIDVTLPGRGIPMGGRHPITQTLDEIIDIFSRLGFEVVEGPEVELDYYNFEALNIPKGHPAREMQATFFISDEVVLRTHTSPVQVRTMEKKRPPVRMICPGAVYRCDSDPTHSPMFHQVEGLLVDKGVTFSDLKGVLTVFVHQMFGKGRGFDSDPVSFRSQNRVQRSTSSASFVVERDAGYVPIRGGWRFWDLEWWTLLSINLSITIRRKSPDLRLVWASKGLPCSSSESMISVFSL